MSISTLAHADRDYDARRHDDRRHDDRGRRSYESSTYQRSCQNIYLTNGGQTLEASCQSRRGSYYRTQIPVFAIHNINGQLVNEQNCNSASYQRSCWNIQVYGDVLSATCRTERGNSVNTSVSLTGIHNTDGHLSMPRCGI